MPLSSLLELLSNCISTFPSSRGTMLLFGSNSCARHYSFPFLFYLLFAFAAFFQKRVGKPDSFNPQKIVEWLEKNKPADPSKLVFYTNVNIGKPMAANFVAHNPDSGTSIASTVPRLPGTWTWSMESTHRKISLPCRKPWECGPLETKGCSILTEVCSEVMVL